MSLRVAVIASRYPYVSHVFIQREVLALRRAGAEVYTFTVRRPDPEDLRSDTDRAEAARTRSLLPAGPYGLLLAHSAAFLVAPRRYLRTLRLAVGLAQGGPRGLLWQLFYFAEAGLLWRACRREGLRHIHAHHANVASDVALLTAGLGGWTWSFTLHGVTELYDMKAHRLAEKGARADLVICVSDQVRSQLMAYTAPERWPRMHVVHCGVPLPAPPDTSGPATADAAWRVLTVGRVVPVKAHTLLVEAVAKLRDEGRRIHLTLAGGGPELPRLRELIARRRLESHVTILGAVGSDRIPGLLAEADVFALPSLAESVPVVLMEAMAAGVPVLATRIAGIPELVQDGVSGLLVAPGHISPLAAALARLLDDPGLRARLAEEGREKIRTEFEVDASARRLLRLLVQVQQ